MSNYGCAEKGNMIFSQIIVTGAACKTVSPVCPIS